MHWRNMLTYDAVKDLLVNKYGFEVVKPEDLSLEQEIRIFRDAAVIVGAEGAGLYAACYSRQGQLFISISDEDYVMGILASATSGRGSDIAYCLGESYRADSDVARRKSYGHSEFSVAPSLVEKLLDVALPRMAAQNRNIDG
jgi:capsular polysaccharide biosynthesis protein